MTYLPYPEPRYRGRTGEASARLRSAGAAPEVSNPGGTTVHYLATGAGTDGQLRFTDASGQTVAIPLSWKGLDQAMAALDKAR